MISKTEPMGHTWDKCGPDCDNEFCPFCRGGLGYCLVCGALEGELTTDCPGYWLTNKQREDTYKGKHDFVNGRWIES